MAEIIRTTERGWEERVLAARRRGRPFLVAHHREPIRRLDRLRRHFPVYSGYVLRPRVKILVQHALRDAHAEGHRWRELAQRIGCSTIAGVRHHAGVR